MAKVNRCGATATQSGRRGASGSTPGCGALRSRPLTNHAGLETRLKRMICSTWNPVCSIFPLSSVSE